jgi:Clp amino terminal domain, pathogenicity island component
MLSHANDNWELMFLAWSAGILTALCLVPIWRRPASPSNRILCSLLVLIPFAGPILFALSSTARFPVFAGSQPLGGDNLNGLSPMAQQALTLAQTEAIRLRHHFVGTEHLLLGLIGLRQGLAAKILQKLGVNLDAVRAEVERLVGTGADPKPIRNVPLTPRVKKVLALAGRDVPGVRWKGTLMGVPLEGFG